MSDLPPRLSFPQKDQPLREDVGTLGKMLGEVLKEQESSALFDRVEKVRMAARARREGDEKAEEELKGALMGLPAADGLELVRSFSAYFFLINMAERVHRIRRRVDYLRRETPQPGSWHAVLRSLKEQGFTFEEVKSWIEKLQVVPVYTAHPTEAVRRTLLVKEQRIARALVERMDPDMMLAQDRLSTLARIKGEVITAWQTDEHLSERPSVADEVEHVLFYISEVIYRIIPRFYENIEEAAEAVYGVSPEQLSLPSFVRFASWVGGDMDGNPYVGPDTIKKTLSRHLELILRRYIGEIRELFNYLSQSQAMVSFNKEVIDRIDHYKAQMPDVFEEIPGRYHDMPYRVLLWFVSDRLKCHLNDRQERAFSQPEEMVADLNLISESLQAHLGENAGLFLVKRLIRRVETFGFHLATLDVRQDAVLHRRVAGQLLGIRDFEQKAAAERQTILEKALKEDEPLFGEFDEEAEQIIEVMKTLKKAREKYGREAVGPYIISMAAAPDDALAVLYIARAAGFIDQEGRVPIDVAPLFETVVDLAKSRVTVEELLAHPIYREHLEARGSRQMIMLGYSDSNKESGLAASRWALYKAQQDLVAATSAAGVDLTLFHGRGGTVSRGGSQPRAGILAAPRGSVAGRMRVTEQGEIIHSKYGLRGIAVRTLELMSGAVLEHSVLSGRVRSRDPQWATMMAEIAAESRKAFRALVYEHPDFYTYFREATPIDIIERLTLGSRPSSRRAQNGIEDLRAIPWVFSWTQNRHILPGWYGMGTALQTIEQRFDLCSLQKMASEWPLFSTMLGDVEMVLAKADMPIATLYSKLCPSVGESIFESILEEYKRTKEMVCKIQQSNELLSKDPVLQRAIRLRNPYVDPMSLVQVDLLGRWRGTDRKDKELEQALFTTVRGIARGLQNTG
jgi:phosphoenolpyruvate carboxylase